MSFSDWWTQTEDVGRVSGPPPQAPPGATSGRVDSGMCPSSPAYTCSCRRGCGFGFVFFCFCFCFCFFPTPPPPFFFALIAFGPIVSRSGGFLGARMRVFVGVGVGAVSLTLRVAIGSSFPALPPPPP
jgi:hypothetical protein